VGCLGVTLAIGNLYHRTHRTLWVVNGHPAPVNVSVDGRSPVRMLPGTTLEFTVGEGHHRAEVTGPVTKAVQVDVRAPFWSRWTTSPAWVLNPGGAAVLMEQTTLYRGRTASPAAVRIHAGVETEYFPHLDAVFAPLPPPVGLKENEERRSVQLEMFRGEPAAFVEVLTRNGRTAAAADLAEWRLSQSPDDERMVAAYPRIALDRGFRQRALRFLEPGTTNVPPRVAWHRAYLELQTGMKEREQLASRYEAWLEGAPSNSALLYLRGQVSDTAWEAGSWFRRATNADPANPLPVMGLAWNRMVQGAWTEALPLLTRAAQLDARPPEIAEGLRLARLATGDLAALETEHWERVRAHPRGLDEMLQWCDVMAVQGRRAEAVALHLQSPASITGDAVHTMALCLAFNLGGSRADAEAWAKRAARQLAGAGGYREAAGKILVEEVAPGVDFLVGMPIPVREKALVAAIAGRRYPSIRTAADDLAQRLNPDPSYPHHLIARALGRTWSGPGDTLPVKGGSR
jgi:hypothetical protein